MKPVPPTVNLPPGARILVTGGAGFIGSALIWALNLAGHADIVVADFLGRGEKYRNLVPLRFADYWEADHLIESLERQPGILGDIALVLHLGACSSTTETDNRYLIENNYRYSQRLCRWATGRGARFVYASSAATYGDGSAGLEDEADFLDRLRPLNMYGYSKHLFDRWLRAEGLLDRVVGLKYFNVFGPNEDHKEDMRSVVHKAFGQIRQTGVVRLFKSYRPDYPDGGQRRDFLYVKDAVRMTLHLAGRGQANGLFNLGSGRSHTWLELVKPIFDTLGLPPRIDFIDMPETLRDKYQYDTQALIARLRSAGFTDPITPLEAAVRDYVGGYLLPGRRLGEEPADAAR